MRCEHRPIDILCVAGGDRSDQLTRRGITLFDDFAARPLNPFPADEMAIGRALEG
jgi:hypothetical protein